MSDKKISVFIKRPGEIPHHTNISPTLENLQKTVGGYIECCYKTMLHDGKPESVCIICNEEGKLMGLPYNCRIGLFDLVGTIIFCAETADEGEYDFGDVPITFQELKEQHPELWEVGHE